MSLIWALISVDIIQSISYQLPQNLIQHYLYINRSIFETMQICNTLKHMKTRYTGGAVQLESTLFIKRNIFRYSIYARYMSMSDLSKLIQLQIQILQDICQAYDVT